MCNDHCFLLQFVKQGFFHMVRILHIALNGCCKCRNMHVDMVLPHLGIICTFLFFPDTFLPYVVLNDFLLAFGDIVVMAVVAIQLTFFVDIVHHTLL